MKKFQAIQYLKKYAAVIIIFFVVLTTGLYVLLNSLQTYVAAATIDYVYDGANNGLAPDGTDLDITEIYSSNCISQALDNLGLDQGKYPIDSIRSAIRVDQVPDPAVDAVNEALNQEGEASDLQSTKYAISYTVSGGEGPELARMVLDEIIDVYLTQFSKKYINTASVVNSTSAVNQSGYDYIEQMELLESALERTIENVSNRANSNPSFYAVGTGYSFNELVNEFSILKNTQVSSLYAYILNHQVTKDSDALLAKYRQRVQSFELLQEQNKARVEEVEGILTEYVEKLRESNNTAQSNVLNNDGTSMKNSNVLGEVVSPNYTTENNSTVAYDQTTEYEQLLQNWIDISDAYNSSLVEAAYCQYIIDCFNGNADAAARYQEEIARIAERTQEVQIPDEEGNMLTVQTVPDVSFLYIDPSLPCTQKDIEYVEEKIAAVVARMNELYETAAATDGEYNEYLGAEYIQIISSNHVSEGMKVMLYTAVGALLFLIVGCLGVIVLGRIGDIIEYLAFTDHQLHLPNRAACDRYIQSFKEKVLPARFTCLLVQILNQNELNHLLGREGGDEVLSYFASNIKMRFPEENMFVGYNGSGQFMVFVQEVGSEEIERIVENLNIALNEYFRKFEKVLNYTVGWAESSGQEIYQIRKLISMAAARKKQYETEASKEVVNSEKGK